MRVDVVERASEVLLYGPELRGQLVALPADFVELDLHSGGGELTIRGKVDEVLLFDGELTDLILELRAQQLLRTRLVGDSRFEALSNGRDELG